MRVYEVGPVWYADIRGIEGVPRTRRALGRVNALTREEATVEAYRVAGRLKEEAGKAPRQAPPPAPDPSVPTLHYALLVWLRLKKRGRTDQSIIRVISQEWPDCPLTQVTDAEMAIRLGELEDGNYDRYLSVINAAMTAVKWPGDRLRKRLSVRGSAPRWLTQAEWKRLKPKLPDHLRPAVEFSLATGLRRANVFGLEWQNVNIANRTVTVWARSAKGRRTLHLPLSEWAVEVLRAQIGKHEQMVFPYRRTTSRRTITAPMVDPKTAWGSALKAAKISDMRWHDLRHTWATWSVQAGTPLKVLQELGGWATLDLVMVYAHAAPSHLQHYANAVLDPSKPVKKRSPGAQFHGQAGHTARKAA